MIYEPIDKDFDPDYVPETEAKTKQVRELVDNKYLDYVEYERENLIVGMTNPEWNASISMFITQMHLKCNVASFKKGFKLQEYPCSYSIKKNGQSIRGIKMSESDITSLLAI